MHGLALHLSATGNDCLMQLVLLAVVAGADVVAVGLGHPLGQQGDIEADDGFVKKKRTEQLRILVSHLEIRITLHMDLIRIFGQ